MAIQDTIFKLGFGQWATALRLLAVALALIGVICWYVSSNFVGLASSQAMDEAQLARGLARGQGFRTQYIRPIALALDRDQAAARAGGLLPGQAAPPLATDLLHYPDTFSAPGYPLFLSLGFRLFHTNFTLPPEHFRTHRIYFPEYLILALNLSCFVLSVVLVHLLAARLFDSRVAWLSSLLYLLCGVHWQFALSGLSTHWTVVLLLGMFLGLESAFRVDEDQGSWPVWAYLTMATLFLAAAILSRYALAWIAPAYLALLAWTFPHRRAIWPTMGLVLILAVLPWLIRNYHVTGSIWGHGVVLLASGSAPESADLLLRSYRPATDALLWKEAARKVLQGFRTLAQEGYGQLGSNVAVLFFIASFLHAFRRARANHLRWFALTALALLPFGSSLINPHPTVVSEDNQLILLAPLATIFGAAFIYILIDRCPDPGDFLRPVTWMALLIAQSITLGTSLLLTPAVGFAYPPYFPPSITLSSSWMGKEEVSASDIPWANAWYGDRTCLEVPPTRAEFTEISDHVVHGGIVGLLLTPESSNTPWLTSINDGAWKDWSDIIVLHSLPPDFPLTAAVNLSPNQHDYLFLSDRIRWR